MTQPLATRLLGYPDDARLLILNADDFGFCHAINEAITRCLAAGVVRSTTLMVPCPWALHAMRFLKEHPEVSFGVHLTAISDPEDYRWGPLSPPEKVPSLVDGAGYFYNFDGMHARLAQVSRAELELEFRAQIEAVLAAGLRPTHLDWHSLRIRGSEEMFTILARLAREYGLALRVMGPNIIEMLQAQGLPTIDYDFLDSYTATYSLAPSARAAHYAHLLRELPAGLSEWAVHPGLDSPELLALEPQGGHFRQTDYDFWTSDEAKEIIREEGIIQIDYRALQTGWRK